jgi:signal transduction histidine kinase
MLSPLAGLILIVDDQSTNLEIICETLSAAGLEVAIATSGERALQQIDRERPDLILLDIMMPGMDGFATCRRLKANPVTCDIPVMFMTALADTESKVKALELGAVDYVTKPFQVQEVLARVKTHLQLHHLRHEMLQAAIAREQKESAQRRAAELEKANYALNQTLDLLATEPDFDRFLDHVLKALAKQFDAPLIQYWEQPEPGDVAYLRLACRNGKIFTTADLPNDCLVKGVPIPPEFNGYKNPHTSERYYVVEDIPTDPREQAIFSPLNFDLEIWCTEHGIRKLINISLMRTEKPTSGLLLYFPSGHPVSEQQIELMCALAQQVTLAIQLTQLADKAKQGAILNERNRMARDIHDTLAQSFTGIIMQTEAFKMAPELDPDETRIYLDRIGNLARLGLSEARRSVQALRPLALETANFPEALHQLLQQMTDGTTMQTHLHVEGATQLLPAMIEENLLRIAQEALTNAIRHSAAGTITLQLLFEPTAVHLQIMDDGKGFVPDASLTYGFGLIGMQERAHHLEGQFHLVSQPGQGTEITVSVPL